MSAQRFVAAYEGGAPLTPDATDPVTAPPPELRVFRFERNPVGIEGLWVASEGGACDVEVWGREPQKQTWHLLTSLTLVANSVSTVAPVVAEWDYFVRVVANPGGATRLTGGYIYR